MSTKLDAVKDAGDGGGGKKLKASELMLGDVIKGDGKGDRLIVIGVEINEESGRVYVRAQDDSGNVTRKYFNSDHTITVYPNKV